MRSLSKVYLILFLIIFMLFSLTTSFVFAEKMVETPRNETLYINGLIWGAPANFNYLSGSAAAFPCAEPGVGRILVYETLFMFNQLTGDLEPLVGESYEWTDPYTLKVKLNKAAHWSDGTPLTAEDVAYSYKLGEKYSIPWSSFLLYLKDVKAESPSVVVLELNKEKYNKLSILDSLATVPLHPKHIWSEIEKEAGYDMAEIRKFFNEDPVGSGPYKIMYYDDTKVIVIRDDNYWGKALFGKLPAPKYITHPIFKDNAAGNLAFKNGEIDVSQQFIPNVWKMWEDGTPIKCYLDDFPYYIPGSIPSIFFNLSKKGLDVFEVRKAIAMCIDYKKIAEVAMTGYSANIEPGFTLLTEAESKYIDKDAVKPYQWTTDVDGANELLDSIGAEKGKDGIRVLKDGTRLGPYEIECPYGWTDWNASLEIVMQNAKKIGIEMRTKFPEAPVALNDAYIGKFDIDMMWSSSSSMSQPWLRAKDFLGSEGVAPIGEIAFSNYNRFKNDRADEIINLIPQKEDFKELKELYTELAIIYLKNIPFVGLMYRPWEFYTVNETVWEGFPTATDGKNIPPQICMDGAGIRALYEIKAKQ